jgi:hypothetical protein
VLDHHRIWQSARRQDGKIYLSKDAAWVRSFNVKFCARLPKEFLYVAEPRDPELLGGRRVAVEVNQDDVCNCSTNGWVMEAATHKIPEANTINIFEVYIPWFQWQRQDPKGIRGCAPEDKGFLCIYKDLSAALGKQPLQQCVHDRPKFVIWGDGKELAGHLDERGGESLKLTKMSNTVAYV